MILGPFLQTDPVAVLARPAAHERAHPRVDVAASTGSTSTENEVEALVAQLRRVIA